MSKRMVCKMKDSYPFLSHPQSDLREYIALSETGDEGETAWVKSSYVNKNRRKH